jgi:hypothetical protein
MVKGKGTHIMVIASRHGNFKKWGIEKGDELRIKYF